MELANIDPNTEVTLTLKQVLDLTTANTYTVLKSLGFNQWVHRAELERTPGFSRHKINKLISLEILTPHKRTDIESNKTWFLREQIAIIIAKGINKI